MMVSSAALTLVTVIVDGFYKQPVGAGSQIGVACHVDSGWCGHPFVIKAFKLVLIGGFFGEYVVVSRKCD